MSMSQLAIGTGILSVALSAIVGVTIPDPPPILIHDLRWEGDTVVQDRTVYGAGETFKMDWAAVVVEAATGEPVPGCDGHGEFPYSVGRKQAQMDLPRWVGSETCTLESLPPGSYVLRANWEWGDGQTSAQSNVFEVTE